MLDTLRPLQDRLLVQRIEGMEEKTVGGIIIPDTSKEKGQTGKVLAVGPGRLTPEGKLVPMDVKKGDTIFFGKYAGTEVSDSLLIIRADEVLAIVE